MSENQDERPWPDVPRICLGFGIPTTLNACVGFVMSQPDRLRWFADAYREAATRLYRSTLETSLDLDSIVFPIAFLWRHHVELMLKDIIAKGRWLEGGSPTFPFGHHLGALWPVARPHIERTGPPHGSEVDNVENNIHELDRFDSDSMTFRYPTNKQGSANLPSDLTHVNLRVLQEGMEAVSNLLTGAAGVIGARLQYVRDNEPDMDRDL